MNFWSIDVRWMPQDLQYHKSILVEVMPWCLMAPSHCLNQCWQRCVMPCVIIRYQWVNKISYLCYSQSCVEYVCLFWLQGYSCRKAFLVNPTQCDHQWFVSEIMILSKHDFVKNLMVLQLSLALWQVIYHSASIYVNYILKTSVYSVGNCLCKKYTYI